MISKQGSVFGGALLVAGTAIGGGILAMPVLTAAGGFWPAFYLYVLCWLFMAGTAMLLVDVFLWSPQEVNLVSMAGMTLGVVGKAAAWLLYLFLFVSLLIAYLTGGGAILAIAFDLPPVWGPLLFAGIFAPFIWIGPWIVDRLNRFLMAGLIAAFLTFVIVGISKVDLHLLERHDFSKALYAIPVIFTAFGFQGLIPTLTTYLGRDRKKTYLALLIGSTIPLAVYVLWEVLILGLLPLQVLEQAKQLGYTAVIPLKDRLHTPWLYNAGQLFAFLTILTSFLGVALPLVDFLADGLKIKKTTTSRLGLTLLAIVPPLLFAVAKPHIFLKALQYGGGLGCALLLGLLPILMIWGGRGRFGSRVPLWLLILMTAFILLVLWVMFKAIL